MRDRQASLGVTLMELTVSSGLMGLLFLSGLQLLTSISTAQSTILKPSRQMLSLDASHLEALLRMKLQDTRQVEIGENGRTIRFQREDVIYQLTFKRNADCESWLLMEQRENQKPTIVFRWKSAKTDRYRFDLQAEHLLTVYFDKTVSPLTIWLRNIS